MKTQKTAIIIGATGLIGRNLVNLLIEDKYFSSIKLFVRRKSGFTSPKIQEYIVNFDEISSYCKLVQGDVLFSCLGTTLKQAGSKKAQYHIDYAYQYQFAELAAENGVSSLVLVSSANANSKSIFFYSRVKGELDEAVAELPFERVLIFRPSVLMGERGSKRPGEELGAKIINRIGKLIPSLDKYSGIAATDVALAMISAYKKQQSSKTVIYTLDEILELIK